MSIFPSPWAEAEHEFNLLSMRMRHEMERAAGKDVPPDFVQAEAYPLTYRAAVLVEAAFGCFRSPPSGARFVITLREVRPERWRVTVQIVYGPLVPREDIPATLRALGPCTRCGGRDHHVALDGSVFNGPCRRRPGRLP